VHVCICPCVFYMYVRVHASVLEHVSMCVGECAFVTVLTWMLFGR